MSARASSDKGIAVSKPKSDVYTAMLGISLAAIIVAILLMYLELKEYDFEMKPVRALLEAPLDTVRAAAGRYLGIFV